MAATLFSNNIPDPDARAAVNQAVEPELALFPDEWRVSILASQSNARWQIRVWGPGVQRIEFLDAAWDLTPKGVQQLIHRLRLELVRNPGATP